MQFRLDNDFPSGLSNPQGITWDDDNNRLLIVDDSGDELWQLTNLSNPSACNSK